MINVLMYHSIAEGSGPTSIPPETFRRQIETMAECGYQTISLASFKSWHSGALDLPEKPVAITFDDGFADFADTAFSILRKHKFTATVFLPTGKIGATEDWEPTKRPLMSWSQVAELAKQGIDFGGHSVNHSDLTKLSAEHVAYEIKRCHDDIAEKVGRSPVSFAPPYGRSGEREREFVKRHFQLSLGTRFQRAGRQDDLYDIPRIEMHYFRDPHRWRAFLEGRSEWYFAARRTLRNVKAFASRF
jgi:Predicted xylanase/chitin deacetylase